MVLAGTGTACTTRDTHAPGGQGLELSGTVRAVTGEPVSGATVAVGGRSTTTDGSGHYRLDDVAEGVQLVHAEAPGRRARTVAVAIAEGAMADLQLSPKDGIELVFTGDAAFAGPDLPGDATEAAYSAAVAPLAPLTKDADAVIVSLVGVLGASTERHPTQPVLVAGPAAAAAALRALGARVATLATEHAYDYLDEGIASTLAALGGVGVSAIGAGKNEQEAYATTVVEANGVRVGLADFSAWTGRIGEYLVPQPPFFDAIGSRAGIARLDGTRLAAVIAELRGRSDRVVVVLHGGAPYAIEPTRELTDAAHRAIDSGADLVVAHGPHVVQGVESYAGRFIFYSLGNLVRAEDETDGWEGTLLRVRLPKIGAIDDLSLTPIFLQTTFPYAAGGPIGRRVLRQIAERSASLGVTVLDDGRVRSGTATDLPGREETGTRDAAVIPTEGATFTLEDLLGPNRSLSALQVQVPSDATLWVGRDLMTVGDLEDGLADGQFGPPTGIDVGRATRVTEGGLAGGRLALGLCRSGSANDTAVARSAKLLLSAETKAISLCGCWRGDSGTTGAARVYFWETLDANTPPLEPSSVVQGAAPADWSCFCQAASVPPTARYASLRVEHTPTAEDNACVEYDRLRLIAWEPQAHPAVTLPVPNRIGFVRVTGAGGEAQATLRYTVRETTTP